MSFGKRLKEARLKAGLSQKDVAGSLSTKSPVIGRYERDEAKPSIEAAAKLANLLGVSLDYLVGNSSSDVDANTLNQVLELQDLDKDEREHILKTLKSLIRDAKARAAYG